MPQRKSSGPQKGAGNRTNNSFRRRENVRQPRPAILIVSEGLQTEPNYFKALRESLRLRTVDVEVIGNRGDPLDTVKTAINRREARKASDPFDEVWCVLDVEGPHYTSHTHLPKAIQRAMAEGIQLAISNPSFEYWYLLHFTETDRTFRNAQELLDALSLHYPSYRKNKNIFHDLPDVQPIILRAERLLKQVRAFNPGNDYPNPCTTVHKLVRTLHEMAAL